MSKKVIIVGDSRKMKGGVSTVIKTVERTVLWKKYHCYWLECQINTSVVQKLLYLFRGIIKGLWKIPQYDIAHFHTTPGNGMRVQLPLILYALMWRKKLILHLHVGNQMKNYTNDRVFRFCSNHADKIVTLGKTWMQYVPVKDKSKITYLYNPALNVHKQEQADKYFLFAAYLDAELNKGYDTLIQAWGLVAPHHPDWKLVVCGSGETAMLQRFIEEAGVCDSVETPGWVEGSRKEDYFKRAYAYVMASRNEGLPMTVLEAIANGVPVISTPVGCLPEFLQDRQSVLFFNFGDVEGLAQRMSELIKNVALREQIAEQAGKIVQSTMVVEKHAKRLEQIYESV